MTVSRQLSRTNSFSETVDVVNDQTDKILALAFANSTLKDQNERLSQSITESNLALKARTEESTRALETADEETRLLRNKLVILESVLNDKKLLHAADNRTLTAENTRLTQIHNRQTGEVESLKRLYEASNQVYMHVNNPSNYDQPVYTALGLWAHDTALSNMGPNPFVPFKQVMAEATLGNL